MKSASKIKYIIKTIMGIEWELRMSVISDDEYPRNENEERSLSRFCSREG